MRSNLISLAIALVIGGGAGYGHIQSAYTETNKHIETIQYESAVEEEVEVVYRDEDIPEEVQLAAEKWGAEYYIVPEILEAMAFYESTYRAEVDNGNCKGLMQINIKFHKDRMEKLGITDIHDADQNMHLAADYLAELRRQNPEIEDVLKKYSGSTTDKYSNKVLKLAEELEIKHNKK